MISATLPALAGWRAHRQHAAVPAAALDTIALFPTPEHIAFERRLAGPMVRLFAWVIDLLVRGAALLVLLIALLIVGAKAGIGFWLLAWFIADWLLGGFLEWRWRGLTPGKRMCGIRVIGADGLPASAGACFLRNIMRAADVLPTAFTALAAMAANGRFQRLGDLVAGTVVVYDEDTSPARPALVQEAPVRELAARLPAETASVVDGPTLRAIGAYIARRRRFHPARRAELASPLAAALARRLGLPAKTDPDHLLCAVHAALAASASDEARGAAAVRAAAHLQRRQGAWTRLDGWLRSGKAERGPGGEPAPVAFAAAYRAACADLALADAYHLPERTVAHLHSLVARTHQRFHHRLGVPWSAMRQAVLVDVPRRLNGDWCLRVAMAAFFGTFLVGGVLGYAAPELAGRFLGPDILDDMREMYHQAPHGRDASSGGFMAGFYIRNNVGIALACFASGIFLGVGSLLWLAGNGAFIGLIFGHMATEDAATRANFFEFVSAHGPFELFGITLAGAAGLRMGLGLFRHDGLTRGASLVAAARAATPVLAVAAVLVALAAPIEAFVSPSSLPLWCKRTVMGLCAAAVVGYVAVLGRKGRGA